MVEASYLIPKQRHAVWTPALEPLALEDEPGVEIPLLGYVAAGRPVESPEDRASVRVPRHMVRKNSYALRVRGHSMIDDQIQDGDIIIVEKRQTADNGETVVALSSRASRSPSSASMSNLTASACSRPTRRWRRSTCGMTRSRSSGSSRGWCG